jgi:tRNA 2-thiocytidine biosynthesis protein TtcA
METERHILRLCGTAIKNHEMISDGDRILVAFSGGKDSFAMLDILGKLLVKSPVKFTLVPVMIDPGYKLDYTKIKRSLKIRGYDLQIVKTKILDVVKKQMGTKKNTGTYCFMCSRLRRGILEKAAKQKGCGKIALGHNLDDAIETFFMNMFYVSKLEILRPNYRSGKNIRIIRPLIDVPESMIKKYAEESGFPILKPKCLLKKKDSKREKMKRLISGLSKDNKMFYFSMKNAMGKLIPR